MHTYTVNIPNQTFWIMLDLQISQDDKCIHFCCHAICSQRQPYLICHRESNCMHYFAPEFFKIQGLLYSASALACRRKNKPAVRRVIAKNMFCFLLQAACRQKYKHLSPLLTCKSGIIQHDWFVILTVTYINYCHF